MTYKIMLGIFGLLCLACSQPDPPFDKGKASEEILQLHHAQRDHHFKNQAKEFISQLSENHISANRGEVSSSSEEENLQRFQNYFDQVEFVKWKDTDYGPMVEQVDIIQNVIDSSSTRKDTFQFNFYEILINDANFIKIEQ